MGTSSPPGGWRRAVALALALLLVAAACGNDAAEAPENGEDPEVTDAGVDDEAGVPTPGGRVVYGLEAETSAGWCLAEAQLAIAGIQVARTLYDTLMAPNADGEYVGVLAESYEANADYTEHTLTIRDDVVFHDGTPLDADVVANNLDAFRGTYAEPAEGADPRPERHGDGTRAPLLFSIVLSNIDTIETDGDMTVTITTAEPWPALPAFLFSSGRLGMMAQDQLDSDRCNTEMIGTGPFELVSWQVDDRLVARRNDNYWKTDDDGNQLPYLDEIEYRPITEATQRVNQLESGEIQAMHTDNSIMHDRLRTMYEAGSINLVESDAFGEVSYFMLHSGKPPFDSQTARLAVAHSLDRQRINEVRSLSIPTIATGPFAPGNVGHLEETPYPEHDLERARELVQQYEEEIGGQFVVNLSSTPSPEVVETGDLLQEMMEDAGITVRRQQIEQAQLINTALSGDFEMIQWRNHPGGDPDTQLVWWRSGYPTNFGRIEDPDVDRLLDEGRVALDPDERTANYEELNRVMAERAYNLWQSWTIWAIATATNVYGVMGPSLPDGSPPFPGLATGHPVETMWVQS